VLCLALLQLLAMCSIGAGHLPNFFVQKQLSLPGLVHLSCHAQVQQVQLLATVSLWLHDLHVCLTAAAALYLCSQNISCIMLPCRCHPPQPAPRP
jgi:hypothetical protein